MHHPFPLFSRRLLRAGVFTAGLLACFVAPVRAAGDAASLRPLIDEQFAFAEKQYAGLLYRIGEDKTRLPRSFENGKLKLVPPRDWTSGFFPGCLWLVHEQTGSAAMKAAAEDFTARVESIKDFSGHHDVGFMLYCSYGEGYRLTKNPAFRDVLIQGARSLSKRYDPKVGLIRSWDFGKWKYPVIIDNMMNLELMMFAHEQTGEASFKEIALNHANKTLANHFRPDGSSFHLVDYDPATGEPTKKQTVQGHADDSVWARGQSWGFYGYTMMYRFTRDPAYLAQARKIADFLINHPRLPADKIPYWDYDAPSIPDAPRDASAGALMSSALLELSEYVEPPTAARYRAVALQQLRSLSSPAYRAALGENGNFLLMHCVGHIPEKHEIDTPLIYADYYFLEALRRAKSHLAKN
jgi:unsaturated chondroitin disaccharide hydrolase